MTRTAVVALIGGLAVCAGPAAGDPSFEVPRSAQHAPAQPGAFSSPTVGAPAPTPAAPAPAQDAPAGADDNGRYSFHRIGDGFVRLDSRTGQLAQCGWMATGWSCKLVPDERAALESEIARLQRENGALKKSLLSKGLSLPSEVMAETPAPRVDAPVPPAKVPDAASQAPKAPSDLDLNLDRAIAYVKDVWRKLVDMMIDLQRDVQRKS